MLLLIFLINFPIFLTDQDETRLKYFEYWHAKMFIYGYFFSSVTIAISWWFIPNSDSAFSQTTLKWYPARIVDCKRPTLSRLYQASLCAETRPPAKCHSTPTWGSPGSTLPDPSFKNCRSVNTFGHWSSKKVNDGSGRYRRFRQLKNWWYSIVIIFKAERSKVCMKRLMFLIVRSKKLLVFVKEMFSYWRWLKTKQKKMHHRLCQ